ncbi:YigZ family protein [Anaerosinus massiliensis]|uniref:YigZ family protein n=1 Tax=Massilibacillus massiliensis TaxID=1806837 RepID=UPI000AB5DDB0|nr:YigZ family protein [Massilibacillus massiliensis]
MNYKTILGYAEAEYEISKSRFLTFIERVNTEAEANQFINKIKKLHWEARHNCSAYIIGEQGQLQKADDDGEPSGTAGKPILEVLKKNDVKDIVVVVTRYFGGIKLGAGGLIRAYGKAATLGLSAAQIVEKQQYVRIAVDIDYTLLGTVENNLRLHDYIVDEKIFTDKVRILVFVKKGLETDFMQAIMNWTSSNCTLTTLDTLYLEIPIDKIQD